jgi:DNA-binding YbaB/EbfC family protein
MGTGFAKRKKQAKLLQEQFSKLQDDMENSEFTGSAGNGLVTVVLNGNNDMKQIKINPQCVDPEDVEGLQDLIKAAYKDAADKIKEKSNSTMPQMPGMGGFNFPGMG